MMKPQMYFLLDWTQDESADEVPTTPTSKETRGKHLRILAVYGLVISYELLRMCEPTNGGVNARKIR